MTSSLLLRARDMKKSPPLTLMPPVPVARGALLTIADVMARLPGKTRWWCNRNVAPDARIKLGRTVYWYEHDFTAWIESMRGSA